MKVLIVDDDETILRILSAYLDRKGGYEVVATSSPQEALDIIRNTTVDLLLSDIMMPGMLGSRLYQEISQISPDTVCILISGYEKDMFNLPPGILFLKKPIDSEALFSTIEKARKKPA